MSWENVLDEQIALRRWWGTAEAESYARAFRDGVASDYVGSEDTISGIAVVEDRKLELADPVWVAPDVCDLIDAARLADPPFQPEPVLPSDLPCVYGFLRFERPMHLKDARGMTVNVAAMAWMPKADPSWEGPGEPPWDRQGIDLTLYSDRDDPEDTDLDELRERGFSSKLALLHRMPWWFGKDPNEMQFALGLGVDDDEARESMTNWLVLMQITFRIIQQKITSSGRRRLPKGFRRRAQRDYGITDPYTVVITLRRYESKKGDGPGWDPEVDGPYYSHRFLVSGHWRAQYYPSSGEHRQLYIHSFVKGPEDAELIIKPSRAIEVVR